MQKPLFKSRELRHLQISNTQDWSCTFEQNTMTAVYLLNASPYLIIPSATLPVRIIASPSLSLNLDTPITASLLLAQFHQSVFSCSSPLARGSECVRRKPHTVHTTLIGETESQGEKGGERWRRGSSHHDARALANNKSGSPFFPFLPPLVLI